VGRILTLVVLALVTLSFAVELSVFYLGDYFLRDSFAIWFTVDSESSIPTWYSSFQLLLCSVLLAVIALAKKRGGGSYFLHWALLSVIFFEMSVDEIAAIHGRFSWFENVLPVRDVSYFHFAWVVPASALVLVVAAVYLRFVFHLPAKIGWLFVLAGAVFVTGALGMEMFTGHWLELGVERESITYYIMSHIEEGLEMFGIAIFAYALLRYISSYMYMETIEIDIREKPPKLLSEKE